MDEYEFSEHARAMLRERNIKEDWVRSTMERPESKEHREDGTIHYIRVVEEYGRRYLRVIVNPNDIPPRVITVFFDRRFRRWVCD